MADNDPFAIYNAGGAAAAAGFAGGNAGAAATLHQRRYADMMGVREDNVDAEVQTRGIEGIFRDLFVENKRAVMGSYDVPDLASAHGRLLGPPAHNPLTGVLVAVE
jgi:hypothetical protein